MSAAQQSIFTDDFNNSVHKYMLRCNWYYRFPFTVMIGYFN